MTVDDLRRTLEDIPGHYRIWITVIDDETPAGLVTQDRNTIRVCAVGVDRLENESILYDEAPPP